MENPASKGASLASAQGSSGVLTGRGMCEEKRKDGPIFQIRHLELGRPGNCTCGVVRHPRAIRDQPIEDANWSSRESDPPIVVRDGNAGHTSSPGNAGAAKAKEWAGRQRKQSTHCGTRRSRQAVSSSLLALGTGSGKLCPIRFHVRVFLRSPVR